MNIQEITEGRVKNILGIDRNFDRLNGEQPGPSIKKVPLNYYISINGNPWKENGEIKPFATEQSALKAANTLYAKRPRLRIDVLPYKK